MKGKKLWILVGIGSALVIALLVVSNVIDVGLRLRTVHPYVEYAFYGVSVLLAYVLIINPLRIILFAPTFSVDALLDEDKRAKIYKDAAKNMMKNEYLTEADKVLLSESMNDKVMLKESMKTIFNTTIKEEINQLIIKNAKTVLVSTALSQNGNLDMLSTLTINVKMIKEIVTMAGFRPSYPNLGKLSLNVLITSIVAEGIEDLEINELLPSKIGETMTDLPFLKTISSSVLGGISNALLTCRVGVVTRSYLFLDNKLLTRREIRRMAYFEAIKMMPIIITQGLTFFPKSVVNILARPFKKRAKNID
ncbi:MAG: YcjF family protein [Candidatus Izemoplasmataceae bacterium]